MTQKESRSARQQGSPRDRFGMFAAACGLLLYIAAIGFFVLPLEQKTDTFLMVSFLFLPAIVGGILYERIDRNTGWK